MSNVIKSVEIQSRSAFKHPYKKKQKNDTSFGTLLAKCVNDIDQTSNETPIPSSPIKILP
jgi:tRNA A37 threonylcarbamoyltransferase TsaD